MSFGRSLLSPLPAALPSSYRTHAKISEKRIKKKEGKKKKPSSLAVKEVLPIQSDCSKQFHKLLSHT